MTKVQAIQISRHGYHSDAGYSALRSFDLISCSFEIVVASLVGEEIADLTAAHS